VVILHHRSLHCTPFIASPEQHARALHGSGHGNVFVCPRDGDGQWQQHSVSIGDLEEFVKTLHGRHDVYISQNRFYGRHRAIASLRELGALFVDLDYYKTPFADLKPCHLLQVVLEALADATIPAPSFPVSICAKSIFAGPASGKPVWSMRISGLPDLAVPS
jgi:hypothetical protein